MLKCDSTITVGAECPGHLGKFDSCRDEGLYALTMFGDLQATGDADFQGYLVLVVLDADAVVSLDDYAVLVPEGAYLVHSASSGAVTVDDGLLPDAAQAAYDRFAAAYEAWSSPEWCEDCSFDARCEDHAAMLQANS